MTNGMVPREQDTQVTEQEDVERMVYSQSMDLGVDMMIGPILNGMEQDSEEREQVDVEKRDSPKSMDLEVDELL